MRQKRQTEEEEEEANDEVKEGREAKGVGEKEERNLCKVKLE